MVGKCQLVVILVSIIDTFAISRHIHRGHLFCVEVCLQKGTCSAVVYNTIHNTCQVQHETAEEDELIYPTASVWGLSLEGASDKTGNETFKMWCAPAKNSLQQAMHDIVCMANSVQDSSNKKEAEDINVQIKSPTIGSIGGVENATSSNKSISAMHTTLNKPSDGKTNRSSDSSRKSSASVRVTETLHWQQTTGGGSIGGATTQGGFRDIATRGGGSGGTVTAFDGSDATESRESGTKRTTGEDLQLQSFKKTRSYLDKTFDGSDATASTESRTDRTTGGDVQLQSFRKTGSYLDKTFDGSDATSSTEGRTDRTTRDDMQLQSFRKTGSYLDKTFDGSDATASTESRTDRTTGGDVQLQSFRKTGSPLDTSIEQQKSTAPSVPRRFSTVEVPESIHETVTDQAASRDHSISVEQSTHHVKCTLCCGNHPEVDNAVMTGEEGCFRIYRCVSGYSSKTKVTVVCSAECGWTRPNGSCVKICGELPRLYGAETLPGDNIAGTIRRYQCAPGFSMANDQVIETTCLHTGKWTLPSNRYACTVTCGEPPYLENAVVVSRCPGEITQKCKDGFIPTTPILLECLPSFIWTTPKETCVKAGCTTAPHYVIHASRTTGNSTYQAYKCANAYRETGPIYSRCVDGKWTKPTEKCAEAGCTTAPHYVIHASRTTGNSTYQAYKCANAYRETGPIYSSCVDGKWTKPTEKCAGQCGPPPEVEHAILGRTSSSRQYYDCKPGYKASGKMYAMCAGKRWIKPTAACCMFGEVEEMNLVSDTRIHDASGLAASRKHPGYLYTHNDYHSAAAVYVLEASSSDLVAILTVKNAENYDWEDIAVGPCGEDTCIYIGDIGGHQSDNDDVYVVNKIYRVKEPDHLKDAALHADVLEFDGDYEDAYTLLVDPEGALYVVSSDEDSDTRVLHHLPDNWGSSVLKEAETMHSIKGPQEPWHNVWAGDISPDGSKLVLMIRNWIYYWEVGKGGIQEATKKPASASLTSIKEPQGATFKLDMSGIYIITEDRDEPIYFVRAN